MSETTPRARLSGHSIVGIVAAFNFLQHALTAFHYGPEADEMYYLACSRHLARGFEDLPPGIPLLMWLVRHTTGVSPLGMRIWAAALAALLSLLAGAIARQMGGRRWAQGMAALAVAVAPLIAIWDHLLTMNVVEHVLWAAIAYCVVRLILTDDGRWWLLIGVLLGISFENKYTVAFLVLGMGAGLLFTSQRRWLTTRWFWAGCGVAILIFLPNLLWLVQHHFPFLKHMHDLRITAGLGHKPPAWLAVQIVDLNPLLAVLWIGGVVFGFTQAGKKYRMLAWMFLISVGAMMLNRGREYYTLPAYGMIFGLGTVGWQHWLARFHAAAQRNLKVAYLAAVVLTSAVVAPVYLPLLPSRQYLAYQAWLGHFVPAKSRASDQPRIPMYFQDEFDWDALTAQVAAIYQSLPEEQRAQTVVWGADYSDAAALDYYRAKYGLPEAVSGDVAYWYWGLRGQSAQNAILVGANEEQARRAWRNVRVAGRHDSLLPHEHYDILLVSDPVQPFRQVWPWMQIW